MPLSTEFRDKGKRIRSARSARVQDGKKSKFKEENLLRVAIAEQRKAREWELQVGAQREAK